MKAESNLDRQVRAAVCRWVTGSEPVATLLRQLAAVLPAEHEIAEPIRVGLRISELLEANNREVERRRAAEAAVEKLAERHFLRRLTYAEALLELANG